MQLEKENILYLRIPETQSPQDHFCHEILKHQDTLFHQGISEVELFSVVTKNQCRAPGKTVCHQQGDAEHHLNRE